MVRVCMIFMNIKLVIFFVHKQVKFYPLSDVM